MTPGTIAGAALFLIIAVVCVLAVAVMVARPT